MPTARRCHNCCIDWPVGHPKPAYTTCPGCEKSTVFVQDGDPMDDSEAKHRAFDFFYEKRELERVGPIPDVFAA